MPYFKWRGIDCTGREHTGVYFSRSLESLTRTLVKKDIGLIAATVAAYRFSCKRQEKIVLMRHMSQLLSSGIRLYDVLLILSKTSPHELVKNVLEDAAAALQEGISLYDIFKAHEMLFDGVTLELIAAGEHAGNLSHALHYAADYLERREFFAQKVRSALLMPAITSIFFCIVAFVLMTIVVPRFESVFNSYASAVPEATKMLFSLSHFLVSQSMLYILAGMFIGGYCVYRYAYQTAQHMLFRFFLSMPYIGSLFFEQTLVSYVQVVSLMLHGGVRLTTALPLACQVVSFEPLKKEYQRLSEYVNQGNSLSQALSRLPHIGHQELQSFVAMGEQSGRLGAMLEQAALLAGTRLEHKLNLISVIIQPVVILVLGAFIAMAVMVLYMPLVSIHHVIGQ